MTGAQAIAHYLQQMGIRHIFGLPGTQNASLYCELEAIGLSTISAMHEMGAGFSAIGYAAVSNQPAILALIGGPGFSYAITPLLEACLDSIPLVVLVFAHSPPDNRSFGSQEIDHIGLGRACTKEVITPRRDEDVLVQLTRAWNLSIQGEPGPVMVLIDSHFLQRPYHHIIGQVTPLRRESPDNTSDQMIDLLYNELQSSSRPLFLVGRGALAAAGPLQFLAEQVAAPLITSTSARGVIAENHPLALPSDLLGASVVNQILAEQSTIFAWGIKFSANGSRGFELQIPQDKLIHIDGSAKVLGANYPTRLSIEADVPTVLRKLAQRFACSKSPSEPPDRSSQIATWRNMLLPAPSAYLNPHIVGVQPPTPAGFFAGLRQILNDDTILVLDSGFHQNLARLFFRIHAPYGLLLPTGLQSMGYSLPAAIGAALAAPHRRVVALLGDGGLRMCGMELLSAVREEIPLVTILFDDGHFGLIRQQQNNQVGREAAVQLQPMDYEAWTVSQQSLYFDGSQDPLQAVRDALAATQPSLVHVPLLETMETRFARFKATVRRQVGHARQGQWWNLGR
ncbi:MAG: thiamine pyrophosphate-binding protein [Planctomycetota bacterium]|nr:thiamine pyrophosphate-binding protein [Planctomycetota bacterium]